MKPESSRRAWYTFAMGWHNDLHISASGESAGMTNGPVLAGERVILRPATESDLPRFDHLLRLPEVACWWGAPRSLEELRSDLLEDDVVSFAVEVNGEFAGLVQYYEEL